MYSKKIATKGNLCFVCSKFTSIVLRTDRDFFYVCESHLSDPSFCKVVYTPEESSTQTSAKDNTTEETLQDEIPLPGTLKQEKDTLNGGFIQNIQKALFTQISFKEKEKIREIVGYELSSAFQFARHQNLEKKVKIKQISEKNLELLRNVEDWPKVPKDLP